MSLYNEERKYNLKTDIRNLNQNNHKSIKNNQKKLYNGLSQDIFYSSNNNSQNKKKISLPLNTISNPKTKIISNNSKKQSNLINDEYNLFNKRIHKKKEDNRYKHNKSLEEFSINNDILLQYKIESPLIPGNTDHCGNEIIEILNLNGENGNTISQKSKINNSYILEPKFKSLINNNIENRNNNKINESITDYKNNTYKNNNLNKNKKEKNNHNIRFLDEDINNEELIIDSGFDKNLNKKNYKNNENNFLYNNTDNDNDEYLLNSSFENNKNDFSLLYTNNYHKNIKNDMLVMEIQLLIEKILELQKSYHGDYKNLFINYEKEKSILKLYHEKNIYLKKKIINLLKLKEKNNLKENNKIYIGLDSKKNINNDSIKINKKEIYILNKMFPIKEVINENNNKKNILKQIFKNCVYDRYKIINYKLNDIEKNIINRLSKKYQFNLYNNKLNTYNNNNKKSLYTKNLRNNNKGNNKNTKKINGNSFNRNYPGNYNLKYNYRTKMC